MRVCTDTFIIGALAPFRAILSYGRHVCFANGLPTVLSIVVNSMLGSLSVLFRVAFLDIITSLTGSFYGICAEKRMYVQRSETVEYFTSGKGAWHTTSGELRT